MADDDIAVTIDGEEVATGAEGTTQADPAVAELKSQFDELKAKSERAEAERAAALQRASRAEATAQQAVREVAAVRTEAIENKAESLDSGISAANEAIAAAQREIQSASEAGDHAASAKAYTKLAQATAKLERLNERKTEIEVEKTEAARPKRQPTEAAQVTEAVDPFENYLAKFSVPTAQWMREHRDWVTDDKKSRKLSVAHDDAIDAGLKADSPEYFEFVERQIGLRKADESKPNGKDNGGTVTVKTHQRRAPVAPVSGGSNGYGGGGENVVRLSKKQAEAATDGTIVWNYPDTSGKNRWKVGDPIGIQEMARRVKAQTEQGLYDPNNISV